MLICSNMLGIPNLDKKRSEKDMHGVSGIANWACKLWALQNYMHPYPHSYFCWQSKFNFCSMYALCRVRMHFHVSIFPLVSIYDFCFLFGFPLLLSVSLPFVHSFWENVIYKFGRSISYRFSNFKSLFSLLLFSLCLNWFDLMAVLAHTQHTHIRYS